MNKRRSEDETIQRLCINRKGQNFQLLKDWDKSRASRLMIHRKIVDQLDESIQKKMQQSSAYFDVVRQFLTDLLTQKIKYQLHVVDNPETKIKNNMAGKTIHKNSAKELGRLYNITNNHKGFKKLKNILQAGLEKVEQLLVQSTSNIYLGQKTIQQIRTMIEMRIVSLQDSNDSVMSACSQVISTFSKDKSSKPYQSQSDLYLTQQKFIFQAYQQTQEQRSLGQHMVDYLQFVQKLQKKKLGLIKEVIGAYLGAVREEHQNQDQLRQLSSLQEILRKQTENKYIEECYSIDELFDKSILSQFSKCEGRHQKQITMRYIKAYMKKLQFPYFEHINYLVLKEYSIFLRHEELASIKLIITVDAFINIYLCDKQLQINNNSQQNLRVQYDFSIKIDYTLITKQQGDIALLLQTKKMSSRLQQPSEGVELIFSNEDQRQQFVQFIEKIMK